MSFVEHGEDDNVQLKTYLSFILFYLLFKGKIIYQATKMGDVSSGFTQIFNIFFIVTSHRITQYILDVTQ